MLHFIAGGEIIQPILKLYLANNNTIQKLYKLYKNFEYFFILLII